MTEQERLAVFLHSAVGALFDRWVGRRPFSNDELTEITRALAEAFVREVPR